MLKVHLTPLVISMNGRSIYASFWNQYQTAHHHTRCRHFNASAKCQTLITCRIRDGMLKLHLTPLVISINGRSIYTSFWNQYQTAHHHTRCCHFNASAKCRPLITCRIRHGMLKVHTTPLVSSIDGRSIHASFWNQNATAHHHTRCWHFNASTECQTLIRCRIRDAMLKVQLTPLVIYINGRSIYASFWNEYQTAHHHTRCWHFNASTECHTVITCRIREDMLMVHLTLLVISINGRSIYASSWNQYQTAHHHTRCRHFNASAKCQTLITCRIRDGMLKVHLTPLVISINGRSIYTSFWNQYQTAHHHTRCCHFNASAKCRPLITCRIRHGMLKVHTTPLVSSIDGRSIHASFWNQNATAHHHTRCWHFNASTECQTLIRCRIRDAMLKVQLTPLVIYINGRSIYASFWNEYQTAHHHTRCWHFNASTECHTVITCRIREDMLMVHLTLLVISINGRSIYASSWNQYQTAPHHTRCRHFNASAKCQTLITCRIRDGMLKVHLKPVVISINGRSIYASFWNQYQTAHHHTRCWHFNASAKCRPLITCRIRHGMLKVHTTPLVNSIDGRSIYASFWNQYATAHHYTLCWHFNASAECQTQITCRIRDDMLKIHHALLVISMNERSIYASFWNQYQTAHHHTRCRHFNGSMKCQRLITCRIRDGMLKVHLTPLVISINGRSIYASFWNQYQTAHHHTRCWHFNASAEWQTLIRCRIRDDMLKVHLTLLVISINGRSIYASFCNQYQTAHHHTRCCHFNASAKCRPLITCRIRHGMLKVHTTPLVSSIDGRSIHASFWNQNATAHHHTGCWHFNASTECQTLIRCRIRDAMLKVQLTPLVIYINGRSIYASFWNEYQTAHHHTRCWHFNASTECHTVITCRIREDMLMVHLTLLVISINGRSIYASSWNQYQTAHHHTRCCHFNASAKCRPLITCRIRHGMLKVHTTPLVSSIDGRSIHASFWNQNATAHHHTRCWHFNASTECQTLIRCRIRDAMLKVQLTPLVIYINGRSIYASFWNEYQTAHHHTRCRHFNASAKCQTLITCRIRDGMLKLHLTPLVISINGRSIYTSFWNQYQTAHHHTRCCHFNASAKCRPLITCRIRHGMLKVHTTPLVSSIDGRSIHASFWNQYQTAHHHTRCRHFNGSMKCQRLITCRIRDGMLKVHLTPLVISINGRSIYASFWNQYQTAHHHTRCWHFNASAEWQTLIRCRIRDDMLKVHLTLLVISINGRSIHASFWNQNATAHHYTRCWHFNASAECQTQITWRIRDDMLKVHLTMLVISINGRSIYASFWNQYQTAHHHARCWHFNASTECQTLISCRIRDDMLKVQLTPLVIYINGRSIYASFWNEYQTAHHHTQCWHFNASTECHTAITCRIMEDMLMVHLTPLVI